MQKLNTLQIHFNAIRKIENLENNNNLVHLNLGHNFISKIENISHLQNLTKLQLNNNIIGQNGIDDLKELTKLKKLIQLDLKVNRIADELAISEVFSQMPNLRLLYLT